MLPENMPLVTAVVPVYNHEKYVVQSIRSILTQTYRNIELIVINDGSRDRSHEMVLTLMEECRQRFSRFEYINRENRGLSATLNQALEMAEGKYFSVLASDDVALPDKMSVLVSALEEKGPAFAAAFGNAMFIDDRGKEISLKIDGSATSQATSDACNNVMDHYARTKPVDYKGQEFGTYPTLIIGNYLPAMSNLVRTDAIRQAEGWTPGNMVEDWEMWLKLSRKFRFLYVDRLVALYRWHDSNTMKVSLGKLRCSIVALLSKEKQYCVQNGLRNLWREEYAGTLSLVMRDTTIPLSEKVSLIDIRELPLIISWGTRQLVRRFQ